MRFPGKWQDGNDSANEHNRERRFTLDRIRDRGTARRPQPPRELIAQSASRGVILTWALPRVYFDVQGWRVYKGDENTLQESIQDRGVRKAYIETSAGTPSSQIYNIFVSSVNAFGKESQKIQVQSSASPETGAPAIPGVPPGYTNGSGGNTSKYQGRFWYNNNP